MPKIDQRKTPTFDQFSAYYWNEVGPELYEDIIDAVSQFRRTEGEAKFMKLQSELKQLNQLRFFPKKIDPKDRSIYDLWKKYDRIITQKQYLEISQF